MAIFTSDSSGSRVEEAFEHLRGEQIVEVTSELATEKSGSYHFTCRIGLPFPNAESLPKHIDFDVRISETFPYGGVQFKPLGGLLEGFPHQASHSEGSALCLLESNDYPTEPTPRLLAYVEAAIEWCKDAASGTLAPNGTSWELPSFRTEKTPFAALSVLFTESPNNFDCWTDQVGKIGTVVLAEHIHHKGLVPLSFRRFDGKLLYETNVTKSFAEKKPVGTAAWILLSSLIYERHRPPRTFAELAKICSDNDVNLWQQLRTTVKYRDIHGYHYILIGFPIPNRNGEQPTEVHWQPIAFSKKEVKELKRRQKAKKVKELKRRRKGKKGQRCGVETLKDQEIPWAESVNVSQQRLECRGSLKPCAKQKRVCIIGCGAIGSIIAEHLVRGGVNNVVLFDPELVEFQNLCRHTLDASDVHLSKADRLARRLGGLFPNSNVEGIPLKLPPRRDKKDDYKRALDAVQQADVLIDCTTDESAFRWANGFAKEHSKTLIHMFFNAYARMLTICCSGKHIDCTRVLAKLCADIRAGEATFPEEEYEPEEEVIIPGAGCWHATFPAKGSDIGMLVSASIPILEELIGRIRKSRGIALVLRRPEAENVLSIQPITETAYVREYR